MATKIFLDANVLIDVVMNRAVFVDGAEYIITRNERDYPYSEIPAISPFDFLKINKIE